MKASFKCHSLISVIFTDVSTLSLYIYIDISHLKPSGPSYLYSTPFKLILEPWMFNNGFEFSACHVNLIRKTPKWPCSEVGK